MKKILITGANRGLGLEFTRQYLGAGNRVLAACRDPESAGELQKLKEQHGEVLSIHALDVASTESIENAARDISEKVESLDIVINNAGIGTWSTLDSLTMEEMMKVFQTNGAAPLLVSRAFLPLLEKSERPLLAQITSRLGSIALRETFGSTGSYAYNASKAALNMIGKMLSIDLKGSGIIVILQSPGWARTDMGGQEATSSPEEVVTGMIDIFTKATMEDTGKFYEWSGEEIPW